MANREHAEAKSRKLAIYLIKADFTKFSNILSESAINASYHNIRNIGGDLGTLYVKPQFENKPDWVSFLAQGAGNALNKIKSKTASAILFIKTDKRIFALAFGYGRSMLKPEAIEEKFGLKVVLNAIDRNKIRVIDRKNLDTMLTHTRTQTSRISPIEEFNLDVQQILLKAVTGEPKDEVFAQAVSGADALSIVFPATLDNLREKCADTFRLFEDDSYKAEFPWVDNISEIKNKSVVKSLDEILVQKIIDNQLDKIYLAVPDIVEWTNIQGFKFMENQTETKPDILLTDYLETVDTPQKITIDHLKRRRVYEVLTTNQLSTPKWTVYHCINCEVIDSGKTYILTEGKWYEVNSSFVAQVNQAIGGIGKTATVLHAQESEKEPDYLRRLHLSDANNYALMDNRSIQYGGGRSKIELCDIFTKDNHFIHVKRYSGSSVLSHLFLQGVNSARLFLSDLAFRIEANKLLPESHRIDLAKPLSAVDYNVVYGIISESAQDVPNNLPFFSKLSLMRAEQELRTYGLKVSVMGIPIKKLGDEGVMSG